MSLIGRISETGRISTYERGEDLIVEWRIQDFSTLDESVGASYYSPHFSFGGEEWWLQIYPNGSSGWDTSGYLDLWLGKCSSRRSMRLSFSLSLKTAKGEKYNEEHYTEDFGAFNIFNRFISRSELSCRRSGLLVDDNLTIVCTMKGSTSAGSDSHSGSAEICIPASDSAGCSSDSDECRHCRGNFAAGILSSHQKKCEQRPVKCPECLEVVVLQKFLNEHECYHERPEEVKGHKGNSENASVNASTQTEEDNEACASGSSTSPHQKKLHDDLKDLFLKKEDCDIIIKVKGSEIPAHRVILKTRSPVFASTFQHSMKEKATGVVEIEDCDPSPFMDFLRYIYYGDVGMISHKNVFDLFRLADKYEVLDLRATCLEFIKQNITVNTFCETLTLALQHRETELISLATDFFVKNAEEILETVKWQTFAAENPTQSNELMIKLVKWFKHSNVCISCQSQNIVK